MDTINIGPLAIPFGPLMLLIALLLATALARFLAPVNKSQAESAVWTVFLGGVITARLVFVALYFDMYRHAPLGMLDIRDGGFHALSGILAAMAIAVWLGWRRQEARMPLAWSLLAGTAFWAGAGLFATTSATHDLVLPKMTLERLEGGEASLASFVGRPTVVNLWATWCPPCRREMPVLQEAQERYPDIHFVFANQGEADDIVRRYLAEDELKLANILLDKHMQLPRQMNSFVYPTTLFFNEKGVLVDRRVGELSAATLAQRLESMSQP